ncbi:MAG: Na+/H+ antiporter subunit G [Kiritimatiellae bacterium]|nr:Na+/H+ antiporter subunit G [Kiritimatiellia bacterium]
MNEIIGKLVLVVGLAFNVFGCIGLIRLPDVYNRLQAATKCVTLGTCFILVSVMISAWGESGALVLKAFLCMVFILITSPTAAHALARGAHAAGVKLWDQSVVDRYREDNDPGVEEPE